MALLKKKNEEAPEEFEQENEEVTEEKKKKKDDPSEPKKAKTYKELKEERRENKGRVRDIHAERKKLRKELKPQGIVKRSDFELFAQEVGLGYPDRTLAKFGALMLSKLSQVTRLAITGATALKIAIVAGIILAIVFAFAYISEERGRFTVNLTADMLREGFELSETGEFLDYDDPTATEDESDDSGTYGTIGRVGTDISTRLFADEIRNCNAVSIYEFNRGLNKVNGSHNGAGYMAYTFYIKNSGSQVVDYQYTVNILSSTLSTWKAVWMMFYEDDKQLIYAAAQDDGTPENLFGYPDLPFAEDSYKPDVYTDGIDEDYDYLTYREVLNEDGEPVLYEDDTPVYRQDLNYQYFKDTYEDSKGNEHTAYGIIAYPFIDEDTALTGYVEDFQPGEIKKYTVVIWLEGDDPDCNNSILGGHVGFNLQFERIGPEETDVFKGLYRTEYSETYWGNQDPDYVEHETEGGNEAHDMENKE